MSNKILIIEDNKEVRENIAEILELDGYNCSVASDGIKGIEQARNIIPDLILCDIMMPQLDGYGVLNIIRKDDVLKHTPFLFLTAKNEREDFRKGMGLGADDFLTKPFDDIDLLKAIELRLKQSRKNVIQQKSMYQQLVDESTLKIRLLDHLNPSDERQYKERDIIYKCDEYPRWIFYIKSGIVKKSSFSDSGKELILNIYAQNEYFGLESALMDTSYNEQIQCLEDTQLILYSIEEFKSLIHQDLNLHELVLNWIAHRSNFVKQQCIAYAYSSVRRRVASSLVIYARKYNNSCFPCLRDDLAALAATAKETLIRCLSEFKKEGIIGVNHHEIEIINRSALEEMRE